MDCVRCKDPIDQDSNFCKKCGMQQDAEIRPIEEMPKKNSHKTKDSAIKIVGGGIGFIITLYILELIWPMNP